MVHRAGVTPMTAPLPPVMCGPCYDGLCDGLGCALPGLCTHTCRIRPLPDEDEQPTHAEECDLGEDCSCGVGERAAYGLPVTTHPDLPPGVAFVVSLPVELDPDRPLREQPDWYAILAEARAAMHVGNPRARVVITDV